MLHTCVLSPGTDDDLEYYVRECGAILGVSQKLPPDQRTGKYILEHIFTQIVEFKKFNQVIDSNNNNIIMELLILFCPYIAVQEPALPTTPT